MIKIKVSKRAAESLRDFNYRTTGRGMTQRGVNPDGTVFIELEDDTFARLLDRALGDETIDDVLMRLTGDRPGVQ